VFADAPGGTQVPESVIEAMSSYLRTSNANLGGAFPTSMESDQLIDDARQAGADLLGCTSDEVVFSQNTTTNAFHLSRSLRRMLKPEDEVVVTMLDHDANIAPWLIAAEETGAAVRWVDLRGADGTLDVDSLDAELSERTTIVAFTMASNALGTITPATEVIGRAHAVGALAVADAVHFAPHRAIDVRELGVDVLFCSAYKFFGPHPGLMYAPREHLQTWRPEKVRPLRDEIPWRWETGTLSHEALAGLVAAIDYLASLSETSNGHRRDRLLAGMAAIGGHERELTRRFLSGSHEIRAVRLYGIGDASRADERTPTFALRIGDLHPRHVAEELARRGVFAWDGNYFALAVMERLGLEETGGAVRIGFCHYNTSDEVDRVLEELDRVATAGQSL